MIFILIGFGVVVAVQLFMIFAAAYHAFKYGMKQDMTYRLGYIFLVLSGVLLCVEGFVFMQFYSDFSL